MRTASVTPFALIFLFVFAASAAFAQEALFMVPSPQALGSGGLYTSAWNDDPLSSMMNPGSLGLLAEQNRVAVGFYPERTVWGLPFAPPESFSFYARAVNVGFNRPTLRKFFDWKSPVSVGFSYHEARLSLPEATWMDSEGNSLGSYDGFEDARGVSIGVGLHGKSVQVGLGWSGRYVRMNWGPPEYETTMYTHDVGFVAQWSVEDFLRAPTQDPKSSSLHLSVHPSLAYTLSNLGPSYTYEASECRYPLPRVDALTLALAVGLNADLAGGGTLQFLAVEAGEQVGDRLSRWDKPEGDWYRNPLSDIQPFNDLVAGKYHRDISHRKGFEVAVCEALFLRWGSVEDQRSPVLPVRYNTSGWGLRASGLLKMLASDTYFHSETMAGLVIRHFDLQYDHATFNDNYAESAMDGTTYQQLVLLWRY